MKKIFEKISAAFEKRPVIACVLKTFIISFLIAFGIAVVLYLILRKTGIYAKLEVMLDLKYNSIIIVAPMLTFAVLSLVCLLVGFLLYFHKYKRRKTRTDFYHAVAAAFGKK